MLLLLLLLLLLRVQIPLLYLPATVGRQSPSPNRSLRPWGQTAAALTVEQSVLLEA